MVCLLSDDGGHLETVRLIGAPSLLMPQSARFPLDPLVPIAEAVQKRESAAPAYLERVKGSLRQIAEYDATKNIRLGIEGRRGYEEIPSERE